ncbi:MAG: OOP family OmpA-OmpF porin [Flavobacteriaceae bacterium]|jgi:OOP family OmpA-OmpF porin
MDLSSRRAEAVKEELIKLGIKASHIETEGFGYTLPIATNATPEGRLKNRRTEFSVIN